VLKTGAIAIFQKSTMQLPTVRVGDAVELTGKLSLKKKKKLAWAFLEISSSFLRYVTCC
jgi:hypothetical protein